MVAKPSVWNILGKLKFEIALILLCVIFALNIPLSIMAISDGAYKDMFAALDVELPPLTIHVFRLSDMLVSWWFAILPVMLIVLFVCAFVTIKLLIKITAKDPEGDSAAKLQMFIITACSIIIVAMVFIQNITHHAMLSPLFKLVSFP